MEKSIDHIENADVLIVQLAHLLPFTRLPVSSDIIRGKASYHQ